MSHNADVAAYYDYTTPFYRYFWHGSTGAVHYGLADKSTRSLEDELLNTNRFLASKLSIKDGTRILDAGCGVGGSSIWLAQQFGASTIGITLSERQLVTARETANRSGLTCEFERMNFTKTSYPDESFDVIWAIESVCHAKNKALFLREAFRLLTKGGSMIIADGVTLRNPRNKTEREFLRDFLAGLVLPNLTTPDDFQSQMRYTGFANIRFWNKTKNALPSSHRLYKMSKIGHPIAWLGEKLRLSPTLLTKNARAGIAQYHLVRAGLIGYGVFLAEKPL